NSIRTRKTNKDPDNSWLPSSTVVRNKFKENHKTNILTNVDKNNQTNNNEELAQNTNLLSKQASLSSECSVETDSLGGVSTLLRRWKDAETKTSNRKTTKPEKDRIRVGENKCFSPRLIRGRQAYLDFLNVMEQEKRRELESLMKRKAVSKFPNQGRIQALLRVQYMKIRAENQKEVKSNKRNTPASRKVTNNGEDMKKPNTSPVCSVDCSPIREVSATTATAASSQEQASTTVSHQSAQDDTPSEILLPNTADNQQKRECLSAKMYSSGLEKCHQWINESSQTDSDWDDDEEEGDYYSYNWISEIARPRSDWECMRQKRYQEMLHLQSCSHDIQQLLERKSVSGFLSSDQRNMLDQLMASRVQHVSVTDSRKEKEKHVENEFIDQTACSYPPTQSPAFKQRSWNHRRRRSHQHHPSIEMAVIYDLRAHMEQIHQELVELRKAVTACLNMQIKNQQQSTQKKISEQGSLTRQCCVCYAMQADSFLYRCGHMCACYNCGLELQCTNGKCPICEDPILDVVRACVYGD
ncbi:hypothetical protein M8C21_007100, partial [Ambrosia artemisiifolia]